MAKQKRQQKPKTPKYKTLAEGFTAKAEDERKKQELYEKVAKTMRGS